MSTIEDLSNHGITAPANWSEMSPADQDAWAQQAIAEQPQTGYGPSVNDTQRTAAFESNWSTAHGGETRWDGDKWVPSASSQQNETPPHTSDSADAAGLDSLRGHWSETPSSGGSPGSQPHEARPMVDGPLIGSSKGSEHSASPDSMPGGLGDLRSHWSETPSDQGSSASSSSGDRALADYITHPDEHSRLADAERYDHRPLDAGIDEGWIHKGSDGLPPSPSGGTWMASGDGDGPLIGYTAHPDERSRLSEAERYDRRPLDPGIDEGWISKTQSHGSGSASRSFVDGSLGQKPPAALVDIFREIQQPDDVRTDTALVIDLWCLLDGASAVITTGTTKAFMRVKFPCKLIGATVLADASGNVVLDIQKTDYATFPTFTSIVASAPPTVSGGVKSEDVTLTDWTVLLSRGDILRIGLTTNSAATLILLDLAAVRTDASDKTAQ